LDQVAVGERADEVVAAVCKAAAAGVPDFLVDELWLSPGLQREWTEQRDEAALDRVEAELDEAAWERVDAERRNADDWEAEAATEGSLGVAGAPVEAARRVAAVGWAPGLLGIGARKRGSDFGPLDELEPPEQRRRMDTLAWGTALCGDAEADPPD